MAKRPELTSINVRKSILEPLDEIAAVKGVNRSIVFRWAIEEYVASHLPKNSIDSIIAPAKQDELAEVPA
jgi:metal-responsive CopG/Arc/MetJ family transcriptional regulator